ncbi:MAG: lipocalin-like domain-containing protein [Alphaproteobacteria bacterium]|nr:lipocalin-like domain-containing protein [Alphaproteobacteria bacterium]
MTRYIKRTLIALAGAAFAIGIAGSSPAQQNSLKQQIVGTWSYVSVEITKSDGSRVQTFGDKPNGVAVFERNGHFVIALTRSKLPKFASNNRLNGTAEENQAIVRGSLTQFGTYTVNDADHSLMLHVTGSSYPNIVGTDRKFIITAITKTEMKWTIPAATSGGTATTVLKRSE